MHLAVDAFGRPVRIFVTSGTVADCQFGEKLIEGMDVGYLLADKGNDADAIVGAVKQSGMEPVIPPRRNREEQRYFDREIYKPRR